MEKFIKAIFLKIKKKGLECILKEIINMKDSFLKENNMVLLELLMQKVSVKLDYIEKERKKNGLMKKTLKMTLKELMKK